MAAETHQPENSDDFVSCLDARSGMLTRSIAFKEKTRSRETAQRSARTMRRIELNDSGL